MKMIKHQPFKQNKQNYSRKNKKKEGDISIKKVLIKYKNLIQLLIEILILKALLFIFF